MSPWPNDAAAVVPARPQRQAYSGAEIGRWRWWGRGLLRGFGSLQLLFVQADHVWHWGANLDEARHMGRERRTTGRPRRHDSVAAWCEAHPGSHARLVLSSRMTHQVLVQDPAMPLFEPIDVERYARHQFVHYHGSAALNWPLAVWLEGTQRGASALHGLDLPALKRDAERFDVRLHRIEPAWALALRFARRQAPSLADGARTALALVEGAHLCWLVCERGALVALRQRMLASTNPVALEALIDELRDEDGEVSSVYVLGHGIDAEAVRGASLLGMLHADHPAPNWLAA